MKPATHSPLKLSRGILVMILTLMFGLTGTTHAQNPQLSLADLLIGLRSKKVTLPERNTILTEAVRQRGVTFVMTPEIAKELETTGASPTLIQAIRDKAPVQKAEPPPVVAKATPVPTPVPTPTPPDFNFYQTRADQSAGKGEFTLALADYSKALELKPDNAIAYLNRGRTHYSLKSYDLSVRDFDKAVELNPRDSMAYFNRGVSFEKLGDVKKAAADYQKAVDLDANNETAKAGLKRLKDEEVAAAAAEAAKKAPPEYVSMGTLTVANAVKMVTPLYSSVAQKSGVEGRVTVDVEVDVNGDVVSVKATSGHQMLRTPAEDAARRSKFKPPMYNGQPTKGKGVIVYNFTLKPTR